MASLKGSQASGSQPKTITNKLQDSNTNQLGNSSVYTSNVILSPNARGAIR
jgi:hypothetical protein